MSKQLEWAKDFIEKDKSHEALTNPAIIKIWLRELANAIVADNEATLTDPGGHDDPEA